jgi:anti-sigma regulatory factor (Ser/Thr protein kinase)
MKREHSSKEITDFIIDNVEQNPKIISRLVTKKFGVSRQSVNRHITNLVASNILKAEGNTRNRQYELLPTLEKTFDFSVSTDIKEDTFWRQNIYPLVKDLKPNVLEICNFGFTEILNNVIDHSESTSGYAIIKLFPNKVEMVIRDYGIGIFKKITRDFHLDDERLAVLELTKGKITTDKTRHSGEGIFFVSKMFDRFSIMSGMLYFTNTQWNKDYFLLQNDLEIKGTIITMSINIKSARTMDSIYSQYSAVESDYSFSRTHVPVELARIGNEQLVSRSQAKRLLARLEPFKEVFLDFKGVEYIGQAFADEIFRVFKNEHPEIKIIWTNTSQEIENMIKRVTAGLPGDDQLKLQI